MEDAGSSYLGEPNSTSFIETRHTKLDKSVCICDPPRENRDKGDSTLTTRFHLKTIDFDFSTLKACSETCLIIISKSFVLQDTLNTIKRARPKKEALYYPSNNKSVSSFKTKVVCQLRAKKHNTLSVGTRTQSVTNLFFEERSCYSTE